MSLIETLEQIGAAALALELKEATERIQHAEAVYASAVDSRDPYDAAAAYEVLCAAYSYHAVIVTAW